MSDASRQEPLLEMNRVLILAVLYEHPMHGYGILAELEHTLGRKSSPGLLYPFLRSLERTNLAKHRNVRVGGKVKKVYELTPQGRRHSIAVFDRLKSMTSKAIVQVIDTCENCGCRIFDGGYEKTVGGVRAIFCCSHCAQASRKS